MISHFKLRAGRASGIPSDNIEATALTLFVGPNNSGKSRLLTELYQFCIVGRTDSDTKVLEGVSFSELSEEEAWKEINASRVFPPPPNLGAGASAFGRPGGDHIVITDQQLLSAIRGPSADRVLFCQWFLRFKTRLLNGPTRINLTLEQGAGDLILGGVNSLQILFKDDSKRHEVRRILFEAFQSYFVIDPTKIGTLRIRFSDTPPNSDLQERGFHQEAVDFHAKADLIADMSDGVKAFTGIILEVLAGDPNIIFIDEPEAFLHPSLAFKLGIELARAAAQENKRIFASTHSAQFLMGCVQSGVKVNIVRLTYRAKQATSRVLPSSELLQLMRHPLLRSTGTISGLFYEFVVVTESDTDRVFYQEINERLLQFKPQWGIPNCLFVNAQNKQTVHTLIRPLRHLGIPVATILDIDALKEGGETFKNLARACAIPGVSMEALYTARSLIEKRLAATGKDMKKDGGINILSDVAEREAAETLLAQLGDYGIFLVPKGELESWLPGLALASGLHGPGWLIPAFEKMGADPEAPTYFKPDDDDVWKFMSLVRNWLVDPSRKGIPQ